MGLDAYPAPGVSMEPLGSMGTSLKTVRCTRARTEPFCFFRKMVRYTRAHTKPFVSSSKRCVAPARARSLLFHISRARP